MDYFSLCRKACPVKDFLKSIHRSNPVTVVEMSILTPKTHDIVKCRSILLEGKLLFLLSPYPSFSKSFKLIPLDSKWYPDFAGDFLCLFICVTVFSLSFMSNKNFRVSQMYLYGLECEMYGSALFLVLHLDYLYDFCSLFLSKLPSCLTGWSPTLNCRHTVHPFCVFFATPTLAPWGRCRAKGNLPLAVEPARMGAGK